MCIVCNVPKAETSFNLAEDIHLPRQPTPRASDDASSSFALHVVLRVQRLNLASLRLVLHVGSRHARYGRQATGSVFCNGRPVFRPCAVNTHLKGLADGPSIQPLPHIPLHRPSVMAFAIDVRDTCILSMASCVLSNVLQVVPSHGAAARSH
jgi:hypothetical protein